MSVTPIQLHALVEAELARIQDERVVAHIRSLLVEPVAIVRAWEYDKRGEAFPCWAILDHQQSSTGIGYCEFGFGPNMPWGLVGLDGSASMSLGMDSAWFPTFTEAFFDSAAATDLPIWRVYKQGAGPYPGVAISDEASWDATWSKVAAHRAADPAGRYHCSHNIQVLRGER